MARVIRFVELPNGVMLPYVAQGDPSGAPVLLLHGLADSWRSFELLLPHLPRSIRAIALTQRGHGDASRPVAGYHSRDLAADLAAFMDALRIEASVIAGASSGGIVAQRFAIDHPERTLGLVLIGSPITLHGKPGPLALWESSLSKLEDPVDPGFVRRFQESTLAQRVPQAFLQTMIRESLKVPARVWRAATEALLEDDHTEELNKIVAPTLILWGDSDLLTRDDQKTLAEAIVGSRRVVYPGGGHTLYWEEPGRVASDLAAFIEGLASHPGGATNHAA